MDKEKLYDEMAARKSAPKDFNTYIGDNGRVNRCAELIKQGTLKSGGTLLDVGGGIGDLCYAVRDLYDETWAIDISEQNLKAAESKGIKTMHLDVDVNGLFRFGENQVDIVTALDFIEHIIDPENFARECFRVLKQGGQVFLNTPNIEFWKHIESQLKHGVFPHTSGDKEVYHGGHLAFYNYKDMTTIFGRAGFTNFEQIMDSEGYENPPEFYLQQRLPRNQIEFQTQCMRLGNPNLLFKCEKP